VKRLRAAALAFVAAAFVVPAAGWAQSPAPSPAPVFVGPTPDPSGTACPGEENGERKVSGPQKIAIPPESAAYFKAHNQRTYVLFVLAIRLDGKAAINFPAGQDLDAPLRAALVSFAQTLTIVPAIPGCARPGAISVGHLEVPDGAVTFTMQMVPPAPPPQAPGPLPSMKF
jgi:hypothetical protein